MEKIKRLIILPPFGIPSLLEQQIGRTMKMEPMEEMLTIINTITLILQQNLPKTVSHHRLNKEKR